ncbi:carotenoid oxygenase family protein [Nostoc sp.]|uniref:carotenoid oxygenase family protein n=1 Tax=Nostoc sp. TaxID=1180 RepID=UPI002FFC2509
MVKEILSSITDKVTGSDHEQTETASAGGETWSTTNPFLQGAFEPLDNEIEIGNLHVWGEIPHELDGTLYRTGGNQYFQPLNADQYHWFDGDGMVHAFRLRDGKASYTNKWVMTDGLKVELEAGRALYNGIYGRSGQLQTGLPAGAPVIKSVAGINVLTLAGRVLTNHEVDSFYWHIDPYTLETLGKYDFGGVFTSMLTAHTHWDHHTNELLFYGLDNERNYVECMSASPDGQITSRHKVDLPIAPWNHDFMFSAKYYIFLFGPIRWRPYAPDTVQAGESSMSFEKNSPGRLLLINRKTGEPTWIEVKSCTAGHYMNAHDVGDTIMLDMMITNTTQPDADVRPNEYFPAKVVPGHSPFADAQLTRITINPASGKVSFDQTIEETGEFVMRNDLYTGCNYRYGYLATLHKPGKDTKGFNSLAKHDFETGQTSFQHLQDGYDMIPGEPIFVPRDGAQSEDDGWIMATWYDPKRNHSEMIILAGQDFDSEPVARIKLDHRVPPGFHGAWIPRSAHG